VNKPETTKSFTADLLIELGCEELPPKSLPTLGKTLFSGFSAQLEKAGLTFDATASRVFYTPRRLALLMSGVASSQPDQILERKDPLLSPRLMRIVKPRLPPSVLHAQSERRLMNSRP